MNRDALPWIELKNLSASGGITVTRATDAQMLAFKL
jgi:hypothetical protein